MIVGHFKVRYKDRRGRRTCALTEREETNDTIEPVSCREPAESHIRGRDVHTWHTTHQRATVLTHTKTHTHNIERIETYNIVCK